jgi:hypothetical protein
VTAIGSAPTNIALLSVSVLSAEPQPLSTTTTEHATKSLTVIFILPDDAARPVRA